MGYLLKNVVPYGEAALHIVILAAATLLYLFIDIYPIVKTFKYTLTTSSFWLLTIFFTGLNMIAMGALTVTIGSKIDAWVGTQASAIALVMLSTLGTIGILQSLTLKVADYKFIDLGKLVDALRGRVLEDISKNSADQQRMLAMKVADKLFTLYGGSPGILRDEFASIMAFANQNAAQVNDELVNLEIECQKSDLSFPRALSRRIAQVDVQRAQNLAQSKLKIALASRTNYPNSKSKIS